LYTNRSGYVSIELRNNAYDTWSIYVEYIGNETYGYGRSNTINITWNPLPTIIELFTSPETITIGNNFTLIACIRDKIHDKPVGYYRLAFWRSINGTKWVNIGYALTDSKGCALISISENIPGQYMYKANFSDPYEGIAGKWVYLNSSNTVLVNVNSTSSPLIILNSSTKKAYVGERVRLYALLLDPISGEPLKGYQILFFIRINNIWREIYRSTTDAHGIAQVIIMQYSQGNYSYKAVFKGSDLYSASESEILVIEYVPKPVEIQILSINPSEIIIGDNVEISVRLFSMGQVLVNKTLILSDGRNILSKAKTDIDGEALLLFNSSDPGIFHLYIVFPGDNIYQKYTRPIDLIVKNPVYLELNVSYTILSNHSILVKLTAYLSINQRPFSGQVIEFYKGSPPQYLGGSITNSKGIATLTYLEKYPGKIMIFSANYTAMNVTLTSASDVERIYVALYEHGLGMQYSFTIVIIVLLIVAVILFKWYRKRQNLFLQFNHFHSSKFSTSKSNYST